MGQDVAAHWSYIMDPLHRWPWCSKTACSRQAVSLRSCKRFIAGAVQESDATLPGFKPLL